MRGRPWCDRCMVHEPLRPDQHACAACGRYTCECIPDYYLKLKNGEPFTSDAATPRGSAEERAFFFAVERSPLQELTPRLAFADWLDDHGRTDEAAILRDERLRPVIAPFRVLPYWREAPFFIRFLQLQTDDFETRIVQRRLAAHDQLLGDRRWNAFAELMRPLVLYDEEAVLMGLDRWPLLPGEPEPIIKSRSPAASSPD